VAIGEGAATLANGDRSEAMATIKRVLAADYACDEADLTAGVMTVVPFELRPGRRPYPVASKPLLIGTIGTGTVISCDPRRVDWMRSIVAGLERNDPFEPATIASINERITADGQQLIGPHLRYACSRDRFCPVSNGGAHINLIADDEVVELAKTPGFPNALSSNQNRVIPDLLATVAREGNQIIGVAAAAAETDGLWQIGVDVIPEARQRGVGRQIVGRLTEAILERGAVPYYSTTPSNIASRSIAVSLGFWPAWTELFARDNTSSNAPD
jgi:GNAT superfamily N-acetyltransferase